MYLHVIVNIFCAVPDVARVKAYNTLELNGFVYIWYHAEGIDPTWTPPEIEEITNGSWKYRGRTEHHVNAHIQVRNTVILYNTKFLRDLNFANLQYQQFAST